MAIHGRDRAGGGRGGDQLSRAGSFRSEVESSCAASPFAARCSSRTKYTARAGEIWCTHKKNYPARGYTTTAGEEISMRGALN